MAVINGRFGFPGFVAAAIEDTATHEVEVGTIMEGDVTLALTVIRNKQYNTLPFVVSKINNATGNNLWSFKNEGFKGVGLLALADKSLVVALVESGLEGRVERVIPLSIFAHNVPVGLVKKLELKKAAAKFLGRTYKLQDTEIKLLGVKVKKQQESDKAEAAAQEAERLVRIEARRKFNEMVAARGKVNGFTADGQCRTGFPVIEREWRSLDKGTRVVLVESIGEDGHLGALIEAFFVDKGRGKNPEKGNPMPVSAQRPVLVTASAVNMPKPIRVILIEKDDDVFEVSLYPSMDLIREARKMGLNGGTLVAVDNADSKGRFEVHAIHKDRIDTAGMFAPLV